MGDLRNPAWMWLKAILFVLIGLVSAGLLLVELPTLKAAALLCLCVWAFARAYYFAFYVIERYIDPGFKFAGLFWVVRYVLSRRRRGPRPPAPPPS
jgi:hypothetical protein